MARLLIRIINFICSTAWEDPNNLRRYSLLGEGMALCYAEYPIQFWTVVCARNSTKLMGENVSPGTYSGWPEVILLILDRTTPLIPCDVKERATTVRLIIT